MHSRGASTRVLSVDAESFRFYTVVRGEAFVVGGQAPKDLVGFIEPSLDAHWAIGFHCTHSSSPALPLLSVGCLYSCSASIVKSSVISLSSPIARICLAYS